MASAVTVQKIGSTSAIKTYFNVPGATTATVVTDNGGSAVYLDMSQFENVAVDVMNAVSGSSSGPSLVDIVGADDSSGTNVTTIVSSGAISPAITTVGKNVFVECSAEQIKEVSAASGFTFRYVGCRITTSNSGDKHSVTFIRTNSKSPQLNLTTPAPTPY